MGCGRCITDLRAFRQRCLHSVNCQCLVAGHQLGLHWCQLAPAIELQKPFFWLCGAGGAGRACCGPLRIFLS